MTLDETHDPARRSRVETANRPDGDFPIQNLPHGVFVRAGEEPRGGIAIGDQILDLKAAVAGGLLSGEAAEAAAEPMLNRFVGLGPAAWRHLRREVGRLLAVGDERSLDGCLVAMADARMQLPARIGDYTDFYASVFHATNVGRLMRPDNPLLPNYKWVPIAYHGRSSSIGVSGMSIRRPRGQTKAPDAAAPSFGPSRRLDYETEIGIFVGPGNALGDPIPIDRAGDQVFGFCLLNDWSARDIQGWEYQPLGPFLAKNFATTISPWIVTAAALAPFRTSAFARFPGDPEPLPYLDSAKDRRTGGFDIAIETSLATARQAEPFRLSRCSFRSAYWTAAQMIAHHSSNGCNLQPGDLLGSGTLSGDAPESLGSLLEITAGGRSVKLPSGEERRFLEDGDTVVMRARAERPGHVGIGFGECRGQIEPALPG